jgi:hypothetical protein
VELVALGWVLGDFFQSEAMHRTGALLSMALTGCFMESSINEDRDQ